MNQTLLECTVIQEEINRFQKELDNVQMCALELTRLHNQEDEILSLVDPQLAALQVRTVNLVTVINILPKR